MAATCDFAKPSVYNMENRSKPNAAVPPCWVCRTATAELDTQLRLCVCGGCEQPGVHVVPVCTACYNAHTDNAANGLPFETCWKLHERD